MPLEINKVARSIEQAIFQFFCAHAEYLRQLFYLPAVDLDIRSDRTKIIIGDKTDSVSIVISGKTDKLDLSLPSNYGLIIRGDSTMLERLLVGSGLITGADGFQSSNHDQNPKNINLQLDADIGSISFDSISSSHAEQ